MQGTKNILILAAGSQDWKIGTWEKKVYKTKSEGTFQLYSPATTTQSSPVENTAKFKPAWPFGLEKPFAALIRVMQWQFLSVSRAALRFSCLTEQTEYETPISS